MSEARQIFYLLVYPRSAEVRAGICGDLAVLLRRTRAEYRRVDLDDSLVADVSLSMAQALRTNLHSRLKPAYNPSPTEDAYSIREAVLVRNLLRQEHIKTRRMSTILQSKGRDRCEWKCLIRLLRQAKYLRTFRKRAEQIHRQNEESLRVAEAYLEGMEAHADVVYVYPPAGTEPRSLKIYAVAQTPVSSARLRTYMSAQRVHPPIGFISYPDGGGGWFLMDTTFIAGPERAIYSMTLATWFRDDEGRLAPHIRAGLESILAKMRACPCAPKELREETEFASNHLWQLLSGEGTEQDHGQRLN